MLYPLSYEGGPEPFVRLGRYPRRAQREVEPSKTTKRNGSVPSLEVRRRA
ncbi:MAG: hypothetical protein QOI44_2148 [Actinomycetota bacterium]|nr:hypothetical protein [Actinomycetota bacterium]